MLNSINPYGMYPQYYFQMYYPQYNTNNYSNGILPINQTTGFQRAKIQPRKINKDVFEKSFNISKNLPGTKVKNLCPNQRETGRNNSIEQEKIHIAKPVTERTAYNTKQLRSIGIPERDIKKYLQ